MGRNGIYEKLSTGQDSTLGNYRDMSAEFFGENSPQVKFLDEKIADDPNGRNGEVIADEDQVIYLLGSMGCVQQQ